MSTHGNGNLSGLRILVVDDEDDIRLGLRRLLSRFGADLTEAPDGRDALRSIEKDPVDLVLTDLMMPHVSGSDLLREVKARHPSTEVVIFTGFGTIQTAVSCLRNGAAHFLTKPFDNDEVCQIIARLGRQILAKKEERTNGSGAVIAHDPRMLRVVELVRRVAPSPVPVLVEGESGTGKEIIARMVHDCSSVAGRPFQVVNAAALPDTLLESELFGHRKGAFTGADRDREGLFVAAKGGTVFLDEVASMSPSFQGKLLRVIQEKVVRPLGTTQDIPVSFRLVAATNRNLETLSAEGRFREDLFYRLGVVRVHIPRLHDRPGDIVPLAQHFLQKAAALCLGEGTAPPTLSDAAITTLGGHAWPGNVRELENAIQRAVIVCGSQHIEPHHLGLGSGGWSDEPDDPTHEIDYNLGKRRAVERFQREYVRRALERTGGNVSQAADRCGMTRAALQRIIRQLGFDRSTFASD